MSSAIALSQKLISRGKRTHELAFGSDESFGMGPRRFITIEEASQVPPRSLRDELVKLYFECFHPFCPVVDEFDFMRTYEKSEEDAQIRKNFDLPLFQAMMFVAFGVSVFYDGQPDFLSSDAFCFLFSTCLLLDFVLLLSNLFMRAKEPTSTKQA